MRLNQASGWAQLCIGSPLTRRRTRNTADNQSDAPDILVAKSLLRSCAAPVPARGIELGVGVGPNRPTIKRHSAGSDQDLARRLLGFPEDCVGRMVDRPRSSGGSTTHPYQEAQPAPLRRGRPPGSLVAVSHHETPPIGWTAISFFGAPRLGNHR